MPKTLPFLGIAAGLPAGALFARANRRWRDDAGYQDYVRRTNALLLWPPRRT